MGQKTYKVLFYITLFLLSLVTGFAIQTARTFSSYVATSDKASDICDQIRKLDKETCELRIKILTELEKGR